MLYFGALVAESVAQRRFQMRVAVAFAISAPLLAGLGIYGIVAYGVSLRRHEFGIRMPLGAKIPELYRLIVWRGLRPVVVIGAALHATWREGQPLVYFNSSYQSLRSGTSVS